MYNAYHTLKAYSVATGGRQLEGDEGCYRAELFVATNINLFCERVGGVVVRTHRLNMLCEWTYTYSGADSLQQNQFPSTE